MSVADKLNRLLDIKEDIKDAISYKTGQDAGDKMALWGDKIRAIIGGSGLSYEGFMAIKDVTANDLISGTFLRYVHSSEIEAISTRGMNYNPNLESIILPNCTTIESYAFDNCTILTEAIIPNCQSLGEGAFQYCSSLVDTDFGNITKIPATAFRNCSSLEYFNLSKVTDIGNSAFQNCSKLTGVDTSNATRIGNAAFMGCSSISNLDLSNADSIEGNALNGTKISSVRLKDGVTIGNGAFSNTLISSIDLSNVSSVGSYCFSGCQKLESVNLSGLTALEGGLFQNCYLLRMYEIPTHITQLKANSTFNGCTSMMSIILNHSTVPDLGNMQAQATDTQHLGIFNDQTVFVPDSMFSSYRYTYHWSDLVDKGRVRPLSELNNLGSYKPYMFRNRNFNSSRNLNGAIEGYTGVFTSSGYGSTPLGTIGAGTNYGNTIIAYNRTGAANPYWRDTRFTYLEIPSNLKSYTATWNSINGIYPYMSFFIMTEKTRYCNDENKPNGSFTHTFNNNQLKQLEAYDHLWMPIVLKCVPDLDFTLADLGLSITFTLTDDSTVTYNIW